MKTTLRLAFMTARAIVCFLSSPLFAQSSPPLLVNDPGTPGPGNWEINILTSLERSALSDEWQIPLFDINFGIGERCQLTVASPFVISNEKGSEIRRAFDGMEVGVKYRFLDNPEASGPNVSLFPTVAFSFEDEKTTEIILPLEWHQEWAHVGLTAELAHIWVNGKSEGWEGGIGIAALLDPVELMLELHSGVREAPFDMADPMLNVGFTWELSEPVSLFGSFGKSLHSHEDETNTWSLVGFQFRF